MYPGMEAAAATARTIPVPPSDTAAIERLVEAEPGQDEQARWEEEFG
jgi:hypothetical protein